MSRILIILLLMSIFGCSRNFSVPQIESYILGGEEVQSRNLIPSFEGLKGHLSKINEGESLNLLLTHGMGIVDVCDYDGFVCNLGKSLDFGIEKEYVYEVENMTATEVKDNESISDEAIKIKIFFLESKKTFKKINVFFLNWSPVTQGYKEKIKTIDEGNNAVCINKKYLKKLVNESFSDITALNDKDIQLKIFQAIEMVLLLKDFCEVNDDLSIELNFENKEYQENESPLVFITGSFGSKILYEFMVNYIGFLQVSSDQTIVENNTMKLKCISGEEDIIFDNLDGFYKNEYINNFNSKQKCWYLLSNQLVLLDAINYNFVELESIRERCGNIVEFNDSLLVCREKLIESSTSIAFFDPNDPLGFEIPPKSYKGIAYAQKMYNVKLANTKVHFGLFANPINAHRAKENSVVVETIVNGL